MKRLFNVSLIMTALLITGCKSSDLMPMMDNTMKNVMTLTIGPESKSSTLLDEECVIKDLRIYIFDERTGALEAVTGGVFNSTTPSYSLELVHGNKRIITLANMGLYPESGAVSSINNLLNGLVISWDNLLKNKHFPLLSDISIDFTPHQQQFTIILGNAMARICINKVTNALATPHTGSKIHIVNAFLSNLTGSRNFDLSQPHTPTLWYNKAGRETISPYEPIASVEQSDVKEYGYIDINRQLNHMDSYIPKSINGLYAFPNNTKRPTRLVVTTVINGQTWYYPINMTDLKPGTNYGINLTLTKIGSNDPDRAYVASSYEVSIEQEIFEIDANNQTIIDF